MNMFLLCYLNIYRLIWLFMPKGSLTISFEIIVLLRELAETGIMKKLLWYPGLGSLLERCQLNRHGEIHCR